MTAPYILNQGAQLYNDDGFATGLASDEAIEGLKFMAESFTIYGMPLTTSSFYDSFRYGRLPIGVSNFETYLKLATAAPELNGLWEITLYPATVLENGSELRYATGSAQAGIMFANTDQPEEGLEFMKWSVHGNADRFSAAADFELRAGIFVESGQPGSVCPIAGSMTPKRSFWSSGSGCETGEAARQLHARARVEQRLEPNCV